MAPFVGRRTALLTTYKRDGTGVDTPVTIAVEGNRAFIRTYDQAWKAKRMRRNPSVRIAPSTMGGKPRGDALAVRTRLLDGDEAAHAARAIERRQPILQGILVPLAHRLRRYRTLHYEVTPAPDGVRSPAGRPGAPASRAV
jgi:PPOX class probable F420-dependent enzyme